MSCFGRRVGTDGSANTLGPCSLIEKDYLEREDNGYTYLA